MSPDITRLLVGADPEASLAECENAARVRATTSAVTAPSNKAWLRRRLHGAIVREYLEGAMADEGA